MHGNNPPAQMSRIHRHGRFLLKKWLAAWDFKPRLPAQMRPLSAANALNLSPVEKPIHSGQLRISPKFGLSS